MNRIAMTALTVASVLSCGAAEPPATQPAPELRMSPAQIQKRLAEMNKKAATQPVDLFAAAKLAKAREQWQESHRRIAAVRMQLLQQRMVIDSQLQAIDARGKVAEATLRELQKRYGVDASLASQAGYSFFTEDDSGGYTGAVGGTVYIEGPDGGVSQGPYDGNTTGTWSTHKNKVIYDPAKELAAMNELKDRYGPAFASAIDDVQNLYAQKQALVGQRDGLMRLYRNPETALAASSPAQQPPTRATPEQEAAVWENFSKQYPGVDVRSIWDQCLKDTRAKFGQLTDPDIQKLATGMFNERCAEAVRAKDNPIPPHANGSTPADPLGIATRKE